MKNYFLYLFLVSACDFEIKCLDCTTETITFKTPEEKKKVNEAMDFLNEVFGEDGISFEKSNIEKIYEFPDKNKDTLLKLVTFKKEGYALISNLKNVKNPPVLFYSKGKFDPKNPNPGLVLYMEDFKKYAARDTINAILPGKKKTKKKSNGSKKTLPRSYGYRNPDEYCYDRYGQRRKCARDCLWNENADCRYRDEYGDSGYDFNTGEYYKGCGARICYDNYGNQHGAGYYRKEISMGTTYSSVNTKGPLLKTEWEQDKPYNNTIEKHKGKGTKLGCVTVAVGQILAYHREKTKYKTDIFNYDWNKISKNLDYYNDFKKNYYDYQNKTTAISDFLWNIADEVILCYDCFGGQSPGTNERAAYFFEDAGFKTSGWRFWWFGWHYVSSDYEYDVVTRELDAGRPVYLSGWSGIFGAHAWVADGYNSVYYTEKIKVIKGQYIDRYGWNYIKGYESTSYTYRGGGYSYIHMNWGWGPGSDSWCSYDYWVTPPNDKGETKHYKHHKGMITVKHRK